MEFGRSITYVTEDEEWLPKLLLGGLISLIPVIGPLYATGYTIETLRNVIQGRAAPLPEITEEFGEKLLRGLAGWLVQVVYLLPVTLVTIVLSVAMMAASSGDETVGAVAIAFSCCAGFVSVILAVLAGLIIPYAWSKYAASGQVGDAFKLSEILKMIQVNLGSTLLVLLFTWLVGFVAALLGSVVCFVGIVFTSFYAGLVNAFLFGSLYREGKALTE
jgi:hypothetical protein